MSQAMRHLALTAAPEGGAKDCGYAPGMANSKAGLRWAPGSDLGQVGPRDLQASEPG
jgi:hypothetical protein